MTSGHGPWLFPATIPVKYTRREKKDNTFLQNNKEGKTAEKEVGGQRKVLSKAKETSGDTMYWLGSIHFLHHTSPPKLLPVLNEILES